MAAWAPVPLHAQTAVSGEPAAAPLVSLSTIIPLTYENNYDIAAARYDLEAAEYAFRQFERGLSQWTPLKVESNIEHEVRHDDDNRSEARTADTQHRTRVGTEKEFFDGSSIFVGAGHEGTSGTGEDGNNPFAEARARFPLFSSFTRLERITARSFEENELFDTRLDYVEEIRRNIQRAQQDFFWFIVTLERTRIADSSIEALEHLRDDPALVQREADRLQIEDEIRSIQADRIQYMGSTDSFRVRVQDSIGLTSLPPDHIIPVDLYSDDYYGARYVMSTADDLIVTAHENDAEVRVLENARENSELKRDLADKGKWDIFGSLRGGTDFDGRGSRDQRDGYTLGAGLSIRLIDPKFLKLSKLRAEAEINKFNARIQGRQQEVINLIVRVHARAQSFMEQADGLKTGTISRRAIYEQKRDAFLAGNETVDNVLQAYRNLYDTEIDLTSALGEFYEVVTELDESCGLYFRELGISIEQQTSGS